MHNLEAAAALSAREQQQLHQAQEEAAKLAAEIQDLTERKREVKLQLSAVQRQLRSQECPPASSSRSSFDPASEQPRLGQGLLQRMGPRVDPVNALFNPFTSERGISLSAYEHAAPNTSQPGGQVPAAAVVEVMHAWGQRILGALSTGGHVGSSVGVAAAGSHTANAVPAAGGVAAGSADAAQPASKQHQKSGSADVSGVPNFGNKTVVEAASFYHYTPLPQHLTALEGDDCKGWTPKQMQEAKRTAWRRDRDGPYKRWSEWVRLMVYVDAKQFEMSEANELSTGSKKVVDILDAAAELDKDRAAQGLSLTQFYKQVANPWVMQHEKEVQERKQQKKQQSLDSEA